MQTLSPKGDPELRAVINDGSTGGYLQVYDDDAGAGVMRFAENGRIQRSGTLGVQNFSGNTIVQFYTGSGAGTLTGSIKYTSLSSKLTFESESGAAEVRGDEGAILNRLSANGQVADFQTNGSSRLKVNTATGLVTLKTIVSGDDLELQGDEVRVTTPNSSGTIASFRANATEYATLSVSGTETALSAEGAGQDLKLEGDEVVLATPNSTGTLARYGWNGGDRLELSYSSSNAEVTLETDAPTPDPTSLWLASGHSVVCWLSRADGDSDAAFEVRRGASKSLMFDVADYKTSVYFSGDQMAQFAREGSSGAYDAVLNLGNSTDNYRGVLRVNQDGAATARMGVVSYYGTASIITRYRSWVDDDQFLRWEPDGTDPGTNASAGYRVGDFRKVVGSSSTSSISANESGAVYTNGPASAAITLTLPTAAVGLRYTVVVAQSYSLTLAPAGSDKLYKDGTDQGSSGVTGSSVASFVSVVCYKSGEWVIDSYFGF